MNQSAMPVMCRVLVPEVLPAVPEFVLPGRAPAGLPAEGRAALAGPFPGQRRDRGEPVRAAGPACWDGGECVRLLRFLGAVGESSGRRGRVCPLGYLLSLPLAAGMAGDDELDAAGEWIASAPEDRCGRARRPDAATLGWVLARDLAGTLVAQLSTGNLEEMRLPAARHPLMLGH